MKSKRKLKALAEGIATGVITPDLGTLFTVFVTHLTESHKELEARIAELEERLKPPTRTDRPQFTVIEPGPFKP